MFQENLWMMGGNFSPSPSPFPSPWTRVQDKLFERALVTFPEGTLDRWQKIAGQVPGKTALEVRDHYEALVHDVQEIDSGRVEVPDYADNSFTPSWASECQASQISFGSKPPRQTETERKKGVPWTEEEHRITNLPWRTEMGRRCPLDEPENSKPTVFLIHAAGL
ncbi:PREDICTED: transcription factor DIVARICATA-like isoform X2 [Nelumbo nucifera]|uniref:Transcription factor DIVARICATA-like isoform X2 n=1 Tax=Nelumbo nucifera TaxID=4432 RepID=A0A1U8PZ87_NELNU|nr:PREDICTED: transcription factor DIVARICATA-like isoform X2 [Nelumbo nucifera]